MKLATGLIGALICCSNAIFGENKNLYAVARMCTYLSVTCNILDKHFGLFYAVLLYHYTGCSSKGNLVTFINITKIILKVIIFDRACREKTMY